jgi:GMP synthase-like glutamine amidotransferase
VSRVIHRGHFPDRPLNVLFVVTEQRQHLTARGSSAYEDAARCLAAVAGSQPALVHYSDVDSLGGSDAVVLSGSDAPWAAHQPDELDRLRELIASCGRPLLGICAGLQLLAEAAGGAVAHVPPSAEQGFRRIDVIDDADLLQGLGERAVVYHSHTDQVTSLPNGFRVLASSSRCRVQAVAAPELRFWGTQFHPERATREHPDGLQVLRNFFALARDG